MSLVLTLIRHGKAEAGAGSDYDRELTGRGRKQAHAVAVYLQAVADPPQEVVASTAVRAAQTATLVAEGLFDAAERVTWNDDLYLAAPRTLVETLVETPGLPPSIALVGHNPGLSQLVGMLTGEPVSLPTGGTAVISLLVDSWSAVAGGTGTLEQTFFPKKPFD